MRIARSSSSFVNSMQTAPALIQVLDDLAAHEQATLDVQFWRVEPDGQLYWTEVPHEDTDL